jgi:hypothetical protein
VLAGKFVNSDWNYGRCNTLSRLGFRNVLELMLQPTQVEINVNLVYFHFDGVRIVLLIVLLT